ncbi:MAG: hypothetical protein ACYDHF_00260 [Candidatus Cryosericum sp.]
MDIADVETVVLATQGVEKRGTFKNSELSILLTRSWLVLAPFDQAKVRTIRLARAAEARAQGASRFQQLWYAAQAPFALIDSYLGMTLTDVRAELPTARVLGREDVTDAELLTGSASTRFGVRTAGEPPHKLELETASGAVSLQIDGHTDARELGRLLRDILGERFRVV